jgi:hypothetical protein
LEGENYNCILCNMNVEETAFHLFFACPFRQHCWQQLGMQWNLGLEFFQMMMLAKHEFPIAFMETFIIGAWQICKQRNNFIFNQGNSSFGAWKRNFIDEAHLQALCPCLFWAFLLFNIKICSSPARLRKKTHRISENMCISIHDFKSSD